MWSDGSVAFSGVPSGPGADPTSANQLARKSYVDNRLQTWIGASQWPGNVKMVIQSVVITASSSGSVINFPNTFSAPPIVLLSLGDSIGGVVAAPAVSNASINTTAMRVYMYGPSGVLNSGSYRINYLAIGS